jgi:hypothetical protein
LNLNNTNLDEKCSEALALAMKENYTIIQLDVEANKNMNHNHVLAIQNALLRNKEIYDSERLQEWKERNIMKGEEEDMEIEVIREEERLEIEKFDARFQVKMEKEERELDDEVGFSCENFLLKRFFIV